MAEAELDDKKICVCYSRNIAEYSGDDLIVVNGTGEAFIAVRANGDFEYTILNCTGAKIESGIKDIDDITVFNVPQSGILQLLNKKK